MFEKYLYGFLVIMTLLISSCDEDNRRLICPMGMFEYMEFGHFYGECVGEGCIEIFRIDDMELFEDSKDVYPSFDTAYVGDYHKLSDEKFQLVKDIIDEFPSELYSEEEYIIGMPDAGDWGGIYISITKFGDGTYFWYLDQNENNMPDIYNEFVDKINDKIAIINQ